MKSLAVEVRLISEISLDDEGCHTDKGVRPVYNAVIPEHLGVK